MFLTVPLLSNFKSNIISCLSPIFIASVSSKGSMKYSRHPCFKLKIYLLLSCSVKKLFSENLWEYLSPFYSIERLFGPSRKDKTNENESNWCVCTYSLVSCVIPERFDAKIFSLKYNHTTFECNIYSVKIDLHYFKQLKIKNHVF